MNNVIDFNTIENHSGIHLRVNHDSTLLKAEEYLPHMYGASTYTLIDEIQQLPLKVSDIYRRLTT